MTPQDIRYISKIQMFQLQTENPYVDDFYCHIFGRKTYSGTKNEMYTLPKLKPNQIPKAKGGEKRNLPFRVSLQ